MSCKKIKTVNEATDNIIMKTRSKCSHYLNGFIMLCYSTALNQKTEKNSLKESKWFLEKPIHNNITDF